MDVRFAQRNDAFKRGVFRPDAVFIMGRASRAGRVVSVVMIRVRVGECRAQARVATRFALVTWLSQILVERSLDNYERDEDIDDLPSVVAH